MAWFPAILNLLLPPDRYGPPKMSSPDVPTFKDQAEVLAAETTQIFKDNPRFRFVSLIGYGTCGAVFRMRYRDPEQVCEDFIVKRSFDDPEAKQGLQTEANLLKVRTDLRKANLLDDCLYTEANTIKYASAIELVPIL